MKSEQTGLRPSDNSTRVLYGLVIGAVIGVAFSVWGENPVRQWLLRNIIDPIGQVFLRGLFMVVVPLVFSSLVVGIANLGRTGSLKRLGWRLGLFYAATTLIAILIGQTLVTMFQPGVGVSHEFLEQARSGLAEQVTGLMERRENIIDNVWPGLVSVLIPQNVLSAMSAGQMLAIIFSGILFGLALLAVPKQKADIAFMACDAVSDASIVIVGWIMRIAPVAVAALIIGAVSKFGLEVLAQVAKYVGVVLLGLVLHWVVTYSVCLRWLVKMKPSKFYRRALPAMVTAFGTSSSNATIPTTIQVLEKQFKVPNSITTFAVPLGATVNMDGTALMEMVAAMFIAQVFGIDIDALGQLTLILLVLMTSVGVAGIPGGSIPLLMSAMMAVGIPAEGIALVLGVDRLLDMLRTVVNVSGDMIGALYLARTDREQPSGPDYGVAG